MHHPISRDDRGLRWGAWHAAADTRQITATLAEMNLIAFPLLRLSTWQVNTHAGLMHR